MEQVELFANTNNTMNATNASVNTNVNDIQGEVHTVTKQSADTASPLSGYQEERKILLERINVELVRMNKKMNKVNQNLKSIGQNAIQVDQVAAVWKESIDCFSNDS